MSSCNSAVYSGHWLEDMSILTTLTPTIILGFLKTHEGHASLRVALGSSTRGTARVVTFGVEQRAAVSEGLHSALRGAEADSSSASFLGEGGGPALYPHVDLQWIQSLLERDLA